ncbi:MAG: hypothetical protein K9J25_06010 [Bacteroidales bacterium]|nr:hypothetical protein [Bacteroidales bacterium]
MKKLLNILFLSCFKATELIEKKLNFKLSIKERIQLKLHKSMCDACAVYEKQSEFLDRWIEATEKKDHHPEEAGDLQELKKIIINRLTEEDHRHDDSKDHIT